jgi:hypothetical protein
MATGGVAIAAACKRADCVPVPEPCLATSRRYCAASDTMALQTFAAMMKPASHSATELRDLIVGTSRGSRSTFSGHRIGASYRMNSAKSIPATEAVAVISLRVAAIEPGRDISAWRFIAPSLVRGIGRNSMRAHRRPPYRWGTCCGAHITMASHGPPAACVIALVPQVPAVPLGLRAHGNR